MSTSRSKPSDRLEGTRIRLARLSRGLTKVELAQRVDVSPRAVQTFEVEGAPVERAPGLTAALGYPEDFFRRPALQPLDEERARFRARRRATAGQRASARADGAVGIELYEWIAERFHLPEVRLLDLDGEPPERAAAALRSAWGRGLEPLPNLLQLAEAHGVRVLSLPTRSALVDAFSVWHQGRPYVFLSTAKTAERSRFDLAHEIAHLVLHSRGHTEGTDAENEADRFASAFLVPEESLLPQAGREPAVPQILRLRTHYGVSAFAMAHRLHSVGRLSDGAYRQDCVHLTQRGFRNGEPGGLPRERSRVFSVALESLKERGIGAGEVARDLGIDARLLHEFVFGQAVVVVADSPSSTVRRDEQESASSTMWPPRLHLV